MGLEFCKCEIDFQIWWMYVYSLCYWVPEQVYCVLNVDNKMQDEDQFDIFLSIKWFFGLSSWVIHRICVRFIDLSIMCVFLNIWRWTEYKYQEHTYNMCVRVWYLCVFLNRWRWRTHTHTHHVCVIVVKFMFSQKNQILVDQSYKHEIKSIILISDWAL